MLNVEDIHTYYDDSYILQGVDLEVMSGEIVCLLGRNGAGKSTTMKSIMGYNHPRQGSIRFLDKDISRQTVFKNVRLGLVYVPEDRRIFSELTVQENLKFLLTMLLRLVGVLTIYSRFFPCWINSGTEKGEN